MAGVFISYRRDDSHGFAARLADDLGDILGEDLVFRDIEIPIGTDFGDVIHRAIAASDALLVVINRSWAERGPGGYADRLSDPSDWVRTEIEAAFAQEKQVVPILIGDTKMPAADMLPDGIRRLTALNAARMTDRHWNEDIAVLARQLRELCPALGATGRSPHKRDDLAAVLRELGERIVDQTELRRRTRSPQPKRHRNIFYPSLHSCMPSCG